MLRRAYLVRILSSADQLPLLSCDSANAQIRLSSVYTALLTQGSNETSRQKPHELAISPDREPVRYSALDQFNRSPNF